MNQKIQFMHLSQSYINVLEGHKPPQERVYDYVYQYKDHLGNVRLSYAFDRDRQELRTLTEHNYYPFGLEHSYLQTRRRPELFDGPILDGIIAEPGGQESRYTRMVQVDDVRYQYKYNGKEWQDELGLNVTAMDFRQYDNAIGRFIGMDRLSELGYFITPYRFAYNNPVYWSDPTGLIENTSENFAHCPDCPNTPKFKPFIDSKIDFEYDKELDEAVLVLSDVVVEGSSKVNASKSSAKGIFSLWGVFTNDLLGTGRGSAEHSVDAAKLPTDKLNGLAKNLIKFKSVMQFIYRNIKNKYDLWSRSESINNILNDGNTSTIEVNNTEPVTPPQDELITISYIKINHVAEPYASNGLRINTGRENMEVPRKDSLNMVNKMNEILKTKMDSIYNKYRK